MTSVYQGAEKFQKSSIRFQSLAFNPWLLITAIVLLTSLISVETQAIIQTLDHESNTIVDIQFHGLHAIDPEITAEVAGLKVGEPFSKPRLENSINNLRKWGVFSQVEVLVEYKGRDVRLVYDLKEGFVIKDINIHGNYPLLERQVRRALFLSPGRVYQPSRLSEQIGRLVKLYDKHGYFDTVVLAIEDYDEENKEVILTFKIKKGKTYRLRDVNIHGKIDLNPKRLRNIIFTFTHYKPQQIKKDLKKIQRLFKKKGFVRARVRLDGETYDYDARKVDVDVAIRQGKRVFVKFKGNRRFMNNTLRKQVTIYEGGDFDEFELEASKKRLVSFYQQHGFEEVQIEWKKEKLDEEKFLVTFSIIEGPQTHVKKVRFKGNQGVKDKILKKQMLTKEKFLGKSGYYLQPLFEQDLSLIEKYYRDQGYLKAKIESWEKDYNEFGDRVILTVEIDENQRSVVEELVLKGLTGEQKEKILPKLLSRTGQPYSTSKLKEDIQTILVSLSNQGYPHAKIAHEVSELRPDFWKVVMTIDLGPQVTIGRLLFVGNSLTRESVLRKNIRFKEGSIFSTRDILQSQINLRRLGIFDGVRIETLGLENQQPVVHALVRVQEKKSKIIDLEAGYDTDTGFSGQLIFNKLNMWGSGKNGNLKVQAGQEVTRLELNYIDPRLRGTSLQLVIGSFGGIERRPFFKKFEVGAFSTLFKNFSRHLSAYGRLDFNYVNFDESKTVAAELGLRETAEDRTRLTTTMGVTYDTRDNYGNPRRGAYLNGSLAITNQFFQRRGNYITLRSNMGHWYSPMPRVTLANALRVTRIFAVPTMTVIPADDLLYLGGDDTVRGFDQDSILPNGGTFSLVHNFEIQIRALNQFQLVGFVDTGIVTAGFGPFTLATIRHSAGGGVRYMTPVGPLRLDYGLKLDRKVGESVGRLHFSFGYFF